MRRSRRWHASSSPAGASWCSSSRRCGNRSSPSTIGIHSRCCRGSATRLPATPTPTAISPTRSASIPTRPCSRRCCGRQDSARWKSLILRPAWSRSIEACVFDSIVDLEVRNMTKWLMAAGIILLGGALVVPDAEARRIGGGRSVGTQRNVTAPPAQTPAKQAAPAQQQNPGQAAPAATGSRWLPVLGGLALGGMLGYLFGGSGVFGFLLLALLAIGAVFAVRALMRRRAEAPQPMQYAGMRETVRVTPGGTSSPVPAEKTRVPAGFDATGFLRGAKMNFLRLQAANDAGRLDEVRELTTTELYEELKKEPNGRS